MTKNFWKMDGFSLFTVPYAYVDHNSYFADSLFAQRKISMKFKSEMAKENSPYCIVFCKVLKKDTQRFEEAMEKLNDKMLLRGHGDYGVVCDEIAKLIDMATKERNVNETICYTR